MFYEIINWENVCLSHETANLIASALYAIAQSPVRVEETFYAMKCGDRRIITAMSDIVNSTLIG